MLFHQTNNEKGTSCSTAPPERTAERTKRSRLCSPGGAEPARGGEEEEGRGGRGGEGEEGLLGFEDSALFSLRALPTLSARRPSLRAGLRCAPVGPKVSVSPNRTGPDRIGPLLRRFDFHWFVCLFFVLETLASAEAAAGSCAAARRHGGSFCGTKPLRAARQAAGLDRASSSAPGYSLVL